MQKEQQTANATKISNLKHHKPAKHIMQRLKHNGIFVPEYKLHEPPLKIVIQGNVITLNTKSEQMAIAWVRKRQSTASPPDKVFMKNFMREFLEQLKKENPSLTFLGPFATEYMQKIENSDATDIDNSNSIINEDSVFSQVSEELKKQTGTTSLEEAFLALTGKSIRDESGSAADGMRLHHNVWRR